MPLYMDIHTVDSDDFSVEDVVKAHMEDLAIQERFGVIQLKYWVNVPAKTLFCLMSGPNKEACHQVHEESHGNTACNIIEVSDDEFNLFLGIGTDDNDLAKTHAGETDTGYRTLLFTNIYDFSGKFKHLKEEVYNIIDKQEGVIIPRPDGGILASFIYSSKAVVGALAIEKLLNSVEDNIEFTISVACGRPVDEVGDYLFEDTKKKIQSLSLCGHSNQIYVDKEVQLLAEKEFKKPISWDAFTIIDVESFQFLFDFYAVLEEQKSNALFRSEELYTSLGLSKSKVYRKLKAISNLSPNKLMTEFRLRVALDAIAKGGVTVSEVAFDHGFSSPTYFSKVFSKRYGVSPKKFSSFF